MRTAESPPPYTQPAAASPDVIIAIEGSAVPPDNDALLPPSPQSVRGGFPGQTPGQGQLSQLLRD